MLNTYIGAMESKRRIELSEISIVIPVKNNQRGIDNFLSSFFQTCQPENFPREIIIVDNNSKPPILLSTEFNSRGVDIFLLTCLKPGPAAARNLGAEHALGNWLLFIDSDCIPTESMIAGYLAQDGLAVGYQGFVAALGKDNISKYYESQQIHQPPYKTDNEGKRIPKYLVTANTLVLKKAFERVQGFNESYSFAGEDIDFGSRLSKVGTLAYVPNAVVLHNYDDGFRGLVRRFFVYGKGNRLVQRNLKIPLYPLPFTAKNKKVLVNHFLAIIQWLCLLTGFIFKSIELIIKGGSKKDIL